jgi:AcrR family transcriptional regulator
VHGSDFTAQQLVKEAGVAIQTMYKHFASKDHVILAVLEDMIAQSALAMQRATAEMPDPVERLRFYVSSVIASIHTPPSDQSNIGPFIAAEHWRLLQLYPEEVVRVTQPVVDLLLRDLRAAEREGALAPANLEYGAWLGNQLLMSVFHHYVFAGPREPLDVIAERVWAFCYRAWGGQVKPEQTGDRSSGSNRNGTSPPSPLPLRPPLPGSPSDAGRAPRSAG